MKINIEIVTGFLGAGKTSFINSMLSNEGLENEKIIIIQNEYGNSQIKTLASASMFRSQIIILENEEDITEKYISDLIDKHMPDRIFIETNGFSNIEKVINIFKDKSISKKCILNKIINVIDGDKFDMYFKNMYEFASKHIYLCDTIIINNLSNSKSKFKKIRKNIESINETTTIYTHTNEDSSDIYKPIAQKYKLSLAKDMLFLVLIYIFILVIFKSNISYNIYNSLFNFYKIFMGMLLETIPFILIGSVLSSVILICIPKEKILKLMPKNVYLSCLAACFLGIIFPICDCFSVTIIKGFIKKKLPLAPSITFLLASPIINPISILSTFLAFRQNISIVICRIACGIIIPFLVGCFINLTTKKEEDILLPSQTKNNCDCTICTSTNLDELKTLPQKIKAVLEHTESEFFNIGKFMILGISISCLFQNSILSDINSNFISDGISRLIFMMSLAFLLSVCSTSDAFIARSFSNSFSYTSILGFLVFGPMIDLKNTIMMFGTFKKKFVIKLIFLTGIISFIVLKNITISY